MEKKNYLFFCLLLISGILFGAAPNMYGQTVTLSNKGKTSTLSGNLPDVIVDSDCASKGWTFAGWSEVDMDITSGDILLPGSSYSSPTDITLFAVYKQEEEVAASLTVNSSDFEKITGEQSVSFITSTGDPITIKIQTYNHPAQGLQIRANTYAPHNEDALPAAITKITIKHPDDKGNLYYGWTPAFSATEALDNLDPVDEIFPAKNMESNGQIISWDVDANKNYRYFRAWPSNTAYFDYIKIEYESSSSITETTYDAYPICGTPSLTVSSLADITMKPDVNTKGTETLTVTGSNLTSNVNLLVTPGWTNFSVSPSTLTPDVSGNINETITISYTPDSPYEQTAELQIKSDEIETVKINLSGTAKITSLNTPIFSHVIEETCNSFHFQWNSVTYADGYKVYVQKEGVDVTGSPFDVSNMYDSTEITGLEENTTYTYYVIAYYIADNIESAPSATQTITLQECPPMPVVTLSVQGSIITTLQGVEVILPGANLSLNCYEEGWRFAGWSVKSSNITNSDIIPEGRYSPAADITLYAVFELAEDYDIDPSCSAFSGYEVPYYEDFDRHAPNALPSGWMAENLTGKGISWHVITNNGLLDVPHSEPNYFGIGYSQGLTADDYLGGVDDWAFTPMIHLEANTSYKVSFWVSLRTTRIEHDFKLQLATGQSTANLGAVLMEETFIGEKYGNYIYVEKLFTVTAVGDYSIAMHCKTTDYTPAMRIDNFAVESGVVIDNVFPIDEGIDVPLDSEVYAIFNQNIASNSIDLSLINIEGATGVSASIDGNKLIIAHDPFPASTNLTVNIPNGAIKGLSAYSWSFNSVSDQVILYEVTPENDTKGIFPNALVALRFNKEVTISDASKMTINDGTANLTEITPIVEGNFLYFEHDRLPTDKTYTVTIESGAILGWEGTSWSFTVVKSGTIPNETAIYGPIPYVINTRFVSDNGRYVTGQSSIYGAFLWDLLEGDEIYAFNSDSYGEGYQVSNDGTVVGSITEADLEGAYWYEGKFYNAESTVDPPLLNTISADNKYIGGANRRENSGGVGAKFYYTPAIWTLQDNGSYEMKELEYPSGMWQGAMLRDMSADSRISVGRMHMDIPYSVAWVAIWWDAEGNYHYPFANPDGTPQDLYSEFTCISANGKYAGLRGSGSAYIMNMETGELTDIHYGGLVQGITNDGFAVMSSGDHIGGFSASVWSEELGVTSFATYVSDYMDIDSDIRSELLSIIRSSSIAIYRISPDGKNWSLQNRVGDIYQSYMLHLEKTSIEVKPRPTGVTTSVDREKRNEVIVTWEAPDTQETITSYKIYADGNLRSTTSGSALSYTDSNAPAGYLSYTVSAVYQDEMESPVSDPVLAIVVNNYNIPFEESFETGSLMTNYWDAEGFSYLDPVSGAGVSGRVGLEVAITPDYGPFSGKVISKPLDATLAEKVYLSYLTLAFYYDWNSPQFTDDTFYVDVTTDGTTWTEVQSFQPGRFEDWRAEIVDLTEYVKGSLFNFRFRIEGENKLKNDPKAWHIDYVTVDIQAPNGNIKPGDLIHKISVDNKTLNLGWQDPAGLYGLSYSKTEASKTFGNEGKNIIIAHKYDTKDLLLYQDMYIQSITTAIASPITTTPSSFKTAVFVNGERVDATPVKDFTPGAMNTFQLADPILITSNITDLIVGLEVVSHDVNERPLMSDESYRVVAGKGDLFSEDGGETWELLSSLSLGEDHYSKSNWILYANLSKTTNINARAKNIIGYNIYRNGEKLNSDMEFISNFTTPYEQGIYSLRLFSLENEKISGETDGVRISLGESIDEVDNNSSNIGIYPNPASLYIKVDGNYETLYVYDLKGGLVLTANNEPTVNVDHLPAGVYVVKVSTDKGMSSHKLVIK